MTRRRNPAQDYLVEVDLSESEALAFDAARGARVWVRRMQRLDVEQDYPLYLGGVAHALADFVRPYVAPMRAQGGPAGPVNKYSQDSVSHYVEPRWAIAGLTRTAATMLATARRLDTPEERRGRLLYGPKQNEVLAQFVRTQLLDAEQSFADAMDAVVLSRMPTLLTMSGFDHLVSMLRALKFTTSVRALQAVRADLFRLY